jgi:predicted phosphodiesterase
LLVVVLADTHIPRRAKELPEGLVPHLRSADLILHAGDLLVEDVLYELESYAPVRAVKGNVDGWDVRLPEALEFGVEDVSVAMIHDSGPKKGRWGRMRRRFPGARIVVFMLLNPGSPTNRRRAPEHTFALLRVEGGEARAEILSL